MKTQTLSLFWESSESRDVLRILDQTELPHIEKWIEVMNPEQMIFEIKRLAVRGAPLIGVVAGLSLAQFARNLERRKDWDEDLIRTIAEELREARPTAVNLMAAIDRIVLSKPEGLLSASEMLKDAEAILVEDQELCRRLGVNGAEKIRDGMNILTHCNTGGLATAGIGTALGAIQTAHHQGKKIHVYVDETRPLLQGARLTTWELKKLGIPYTLICDNMAGFLMSQGKVDLVLVGADRIAVNGDFANKIGTYSVALLAKAHGIPFYAVAPRTTFDSNCSDGSQIEIEQRESSEVRAGKAPEDAPTWNPAFDVTPRSQVSGVIFEDTEI